MIGNIVSFKKCLRRCKSYLYWFERNLPKKVLETLYEAVCDGNICEVDNIRLLRAINDDINSGFKDEFKKVRTELSQKDICAELRVIADPVSNLYMADISILKMDKMSKFNFNYLHLILLRQINGIRYLQMCR